MGTNTSARSAPRAPPDLENQLCARRLISIRASDGLFRYEKAGF